MSNLTDIILIAVARCVVDLFFVFLFFFFPRMLALNQLIVKLPRGKCGMFGGNYDFRQVASASGKVTKMRATCGSRRRIRAACFGLEV